MNRVPAGSMWLVLPFVSPSVRKISPHRVRAVTAWNKPRGWPSRSSYSYDARRPGFELWSAGLLDDLTSVTIYVDTKILVGETVRGHLDYDEWVEVLLPVRCFINRTHFNSDSEYLRRLA